MKTSVIHFSRGVLSAFVLVCATTSFGAPGNFSGKFNTVPKMSWVFATVPGVGTVPVRLNLVVPGSGTVSNMSGTVACYTDDQSVDLSTGAGTATYTLRDANSDLLVLRCEARNAPPTPGAPHAFMFSGSFTVVCGTGRFAGATGRGTMQGWSDEDPPARPGELPSSGTGYWEIDGTIDFTNGRDGSLLQLSARGAAGGGADPLIVGFQICGTAMRSVLVRGAGPALSQFGVSNALANPTISVANKLGETLATNDDWSTPAAPGAPVASLGPIAAQVGAFPFPAGSRDAALFITLAPGAYTIALNAVGSGSGAALVEVYEVR